MLETSRVTSEILNKLNENKNDFDLTPDELVQWENLTRKACTAYVHHSKCIEKLLKVANRFAEDFEYT